MRTRSVVIASWCSTSSFDQSAESSGASGAFSSVRLSGTGSAEGALDCGGAGFVCAAALNVAAARNTSIAIPFMQGSSMGKDSLHEIQFTLRQMMRREKRFRILLSGRLVNHEPGHRNSVLLLFRKIHAMRFGIN